MPLEELVTAAAVRYMCGAHQRRTLIRWRESHGFPEPVLKTGDVELWDAREVRAWLRQRERSQ